MIRPNPPRLPGLNELIRPEELMLGPQLGAARLCWGRRKGVDQMCGIFITKHTYIHIYIHIEFKINIYIYIRSFTIYIMI